MVRPVVNSHLCNANTPPSLVWFQLVVFSFNLFISLHFHIEAPLYVLFIPASD